MKVLDRAPASSQSKSIFRELLQFDRDFLEEPGVSLLIGADEVGRGSLIGPVVAAAVSLPSKLGRGEQRLLADLNDSKKLSPAVRERLAGAIRGFCRVGLGEADREEVDALNIHHASLLAIHRAFEALCGQLTKEERENAFLLLDGRWLLPNVPKAQQQSVVKGDGQSACIAAASVVAKHTRDTYIMTLAEAFPGYGWETNMGYGTPGHKASIARLGLTPHHRTSFSTV